MTNWSPQQDHALVKVNEWLNDPSKQLFRLFGYAGTGKTTMAKALAEGVEGQTLFGAFTGKAAHVLKQKGCPAATIHSMIYHSKEKGQAALKIMEERLVARIAVLTASGYTEARFTEDREWRDMTRAIAEERKNLSKPFFSLNPDSVVKDASLVIIDECSMVDGQMGQDLLGFGTKVLVLGDPAQLPPVRGEGFFTNAEPDVMLDEIHRQAKGNPIIEMATTIRQGGVLKLGHYGESRVMLKDDLDRQMALSADQILVGRNKTRHAYNARMRSLFGYSGTIPEVGERLVCLRNDNEAGLLNGAIWFVEACELQDEDDLVSMTIRDGETVIGVSAWTHHFQNRELPWHMKRDAQEFTYGYALTCHKSQGSQWDDVLVIDESSAFREHASRWLYTAVTRAASRVTVAR